MILEAAIINLTRNLDILSQKGNNGISSHAKLKEEGLTCLSSLLENAPDQEYMKLFDSKDYDVLIGYMVNVLCQIAKNDNSRALRHKALSIILSSTNRLEAFHDRVESNERCCINLIRSSLPGVSSTLFKLIMSDTKLPRNLLIIAIKVLSRFVTISLADCSHETLVLRGDALRETCENLAIRISFLIDYVIGHNADLHQEVKHEVLDLCKSIISETRLELLSRLLKPLIKYIAFITSAKDMGCESQLKLMLIKDEMKARLINCDNQCENLDALVITSLNNQLDNLEHNYTQMLPAERESELSIFCGFLEILSQENLTICLEISERRQQLVKVLTNLVEFSSQQPFLFLTESHVDVGALESCNDKIYTVEKRFAHISNVENDLIVICCQIIGCNLDWTLLGDILKTELCLFSSSAHLYIAHLIMKGIIKRVCEDRKFSRFSRFMIAHYVEHTHEEYIAISKSTNQKQVQHSQSILRVVISIETLVTLVELHVKCCSSEDEKIIILKTLLCPMLNWASASSRAVSEAALSALASVSLLYSLNSTKSLIEANLDYVVDGVGQMLGDIVHNSEITNVLAITFKLSSIESFYYFKDIYEKIFKLLSLYHHTRKSQPFALLFYRTLTILNEWKQAKKEDVLAEKDPLRDKAMVKSIINDLSIERRLIKLKDDQESNENFKRRLEEMEATEFDEAETMDEIRNKKLPEGLRSEEGDGPEVSDIKKDKPPDLVLTEKILTQCISLMSSNYYETKVLALKTAACGFRILKEDENTLLPLVHKLWSPLVHRLTSDYKQNLEINLCAFECLVSMAECAEDFIKKRTLDSIIPRLCLFLESQATQSRGQKDYGPYCMTMAYKCQLKILTHLGALAYHIQLAYTSLWRIVKATLMYLNPNQVDSLRRAARHSLHYLIALDSDCVWYYSKKSGQLDELPFELVYDAFR